MPANADQILSDIAAMLCDMRDDLDVADVTMDATFRSDLDIASIDIVALAGRLQARYGDVVNFALFISGLGLDTVRELSVGELVTFIAESTAAREVESTGHVEPVGR